MAETYIVGETKVRPGAYFNIQKQGTNAQADVVNGVTAVVFKSDFGPLNTAVELSAEDGFASTFGNGGTTDAIQEAINGGANAGLLAAKILATSDAELLAKLKAYSQELKEQVEAKDKKLQEVGYKEYMK